MSSTFGSWFGAKKDEPEEELPAVEASAPDPDGPIDFVAVLAAAGVQEGAQSRVSRAKQLLRTMPPNTPDATKRQIVEAAFQAFDIPTETIVDGARAELEALGTYIRLGEEQTSAKLADGEARIAELEAEISDVRASMALAVAAQERRHRLTTDEIDTVAPIVQFFFKGEQATETQSAVDAPESDETKGAAPLPSVVVEDMGGPGA